VTAATQPHPRSFDGVLAALGGADAAWMVGDNPEADVRGAEAVGLPAIPIRGPKRGARHRCEDLYGIVDIVEGA
jgi:putative hydrolase of the HAD superfamily